MSRFKTLDDLDVAGRRVLLRADLNVPMQDGRVTDRTRLVRLGPTLEELTGKGARVVLISHFGRPKGKAVPALSLAPLAAALSELKDGEFLFELLRGRVIPAGVDERRFRAQVIRRETDFLVDHESARHHQVGR